MHKLSPFPALAALAIFSAFVVARPPSTQTRTGAGPLFARLDSVPALRLRDASGGGPVSAGRAGVKSDPLTLRADLGSFAGDPAAKAWLNGVLRGTTVNSGMITQADMNGQAQYSLAFDQAAVAGVALDDVTAASKDSAEVSVTLSPARSSWKKDGGKAAPLTEKAKHVSASTFRIKADDLPTQRISKFGGIGAAKDERTGAWAPSTLTLELSMADFDPWLNWLNDSIGGKGGKRSLTIEFMDPSFKEVLITFEAQGVTILRANPDLGDPSDGLRRATVQLGVEAWTVK